ncbi:hypothetical protein [Microcoleus sp. D2_18a_B4]|uniref:hypothetical protein n=1 Tax=Microcoleus sp. D2_18a_B4 TaxID=3055329 RepID=UPI002FD70963
MRWSARAKGDRQSAKDIKEGRRKKEEGRRKKEEGRRKKEETVIREFPVMLLVILCQIHSQNSKLLKLPTVATTGTAVPAAFLKAGTTE